MPRIRCRYEDCVFLEDGFCSAAAVEIEPEMGCLTYSRVEDTGEKAEAWEEEEFDEEAEEEEEAFDEEEDDLWDDEDEDEDDDY